MLESGVDIVGNSWRRWRLGDEIRSVIRLGKEVDLEVKRDGRVLRGYTDRSVLT
jgi:hypothetical protein